jgi:hypothetical protein
VPILEAVSDNSQPAPDRGASSPTDDRPGSRRGRIVAVLLVSLLVGAGTFVLMAIGQAF